MKTNKFAIAAGLALTIAALFFALLKFGSTVGWLPDEQGGAVNTDAEITVTSETETDTEEPVAQPQTVTMRAVGDNLIHFCIYDQASKRSDNGTYNFDYAYENVVDPIKTADISVINQETVIVSDRAPSSYPLFNSPKELGQKVVDMGFDVVTMANNHCLDQGTAGALKSIEYWKNQSVISLGAYDSADDMNTIRVQQVNGIVFSYVNFTSYLNGLSVDPNSSLKVISLTDPNKTDEQIRATVKKQIEAAREVSDVVVVAMHWRVENTTEVPAGQAEFAKYLAECGADVIIGTGPHVLQPTVWLDRPDGKKTLCIYSLGNFISGQDVAQNLLSAIAEITYERGTDGKVTVQGAKFIPIITHYGANFANLKLYLFEDYTPELAAAHGVPGGMNYETAKNFYAQVLGAENIKNYK